MPSATAMPIPTPTPILASTLILLEAADGEVAAAEDVAPVVAVVVTLVVEADKALTGIIEAVVLLNVEFVEDVSIVVMLK